MTEIKMRGQSAPEQSQFYATFDGEIVQIDTRVFSGTKRQATGEPRDSHPPIPVIPGLYSLSDAIQNGTRRREAEEKRAAWDLAAEANCQDPKTIPSEAWRLIDSGHPLIFAVPPGYFQRKTKRPAPRRKTRSGEGGTPSQDSAGQGPLKPSARPSHLTGQAPAKAHGPSELTMPEDPPGQHLTKTLLAMFAEGLNEERACY